MPPSATLSPQCLAEAHDADRNQLGNGYPITPRRSNRRSGLPYAQPHGVCVMSKTTSLKAILEKVSRGEMSVETAATKIRSPKIAMSILRKQLNAATLSIQCFDVSGSPYQDCPITVSEYAEDLVSLRCPRLFLNTFEQFGDGQTPLDSESASLQTYGETLTFQAVMQTQFGTQGWLDKTWRPAVVGITLQLGPAAILLAEDD